VFVCFEQSLSVDDEVKKSLTCVKLSDSRSSTEMKNASTETQVKFYLNVLRWGFKLFNRLCCFGFSSLCLPPICGILRGKFYLILMKDI